MCLQEEGIWTFLYRSDPKVCHLYHSWPPSRQTHTRMEPGCFSHHTLTSHFTLLKISEDRGSSRAEDESRIIQSFVLIWLKKQSYRNEHCFIASCKQISDTQIQTALYHLTAFWFILFHCDLVVFEGISQFCHCDRMVSFSITLKTHIGTV